MKKFLSVLLAVCLLMAVFTSAALAEKGPKGPKGPGIKHEEKLENKQLKELQKMVDKANREIEKLVKHAQKTPHNDIDWLQKKVAQVTAPVFAYAKRIGAVVECTYTTYYIDGQYVLVDPLRVINIT